MKTKTIGQYSCAWDPKSPEQLQVTGPFGTLRYTTTKTREQLLEGSARSHLDLAALEFLDKCRTEHKEQQNPESFEFDEQRVSLTPAAEELLRWKDEVKKLSKERDELREALKGAQRPSFVTILKTNAKIRGLENSVSVEQEYAARAREDAISTKVVLEAARAELRDARTAAREMIKETQALAQEAAVFISDLPSPNIDRDDLLKRLVAFGSVS